MICQRCKKRVATISRVEIIGNQKFESYLCESCAASLGGDLFSKANAEAWAGLFELPVVEKKICSVCGTSYDDYERTGLVGCACCYDVFRRELSRPIQDIQGKLQHVKREDSCGELGIFKRIKERKNEMEIALKQKRFRDADDLNGQIKELTKTLSDISSCVVSTRIRLARNLNGYPFPSHMDNKKAREVIRLVSTALSKLSSFKTYYMDSIDADTRAALKENHLISPNLGDSEIASAALINAEENVSVMINEEDHLREQCIVKGLDLRFAYETMAEIDDCISRSITFAFDEELGSLTACPTNLGTGLRASVMLFLPALTRKGLMPSVLKKIAQLGLTARGVYGEGSLAEGYMYQISNEVTLGVSEEEILAQVEDAVEKICIMEIGERISLKSGAKSLEVKDECLRSFGILTNCAVLSTEELIKLSANVKLGICLGYIKIGDAAKIDELVIKMRPSNIHAAAGRVLTPSERDEYRAQQVAKTLKTLLIQA